MKDYVTTGQACKLCRLSIQSIIRACNLNQLPHFSVPGERKNRRILLKDLKEWMINNNIPTDLLEKYM